MNFDSQVKIYYDAECGFCRSSMQLLKRIDWLGQIEYVPGPKFMSEMLLVSREGKTYKGFFAFRRLVWIVPLLYVMIPIVYFPGSKILGPCVYRWIAHNRHVLSFFHGFSGRGCRR
jgi:predicted DCC family thiol-disulfide oxidoreductase YuxK